MPPSFLNPFTPKWAWSAVTLIRVSPYMPPFSALLISCWSKGSRVLLLWSGSLLSFPSGAQYQPEWRVTDRVRVGGGGHGTLGHRGGFSGRINRKLKSDFLQSVKLLGEVESLDCFLTGCSGERGELSLVLQKDNKKPA